MKLTKIPKLIQNIVKQVDEGVNKVKDPICGMKVNLEKQNTRVLTKVKSMVSVLQAVKPSLIKTLTSTQRQIVNG